MCQKDSKFFLEKEKALLVNGEIDFSTSDMEYDETDSQGEKEKYDIVENNQDKLGADDEFKKCEWLYETFGKSVFDLDKENKTIKLSPKLKAKNEYLLCLASLILEKKDQKISNVFEKITGEAVKKYLGDGAESVLIDTGDPTVNIKDILTNRLKENVNADIAKNLKKHNLRTDIIAWKNIDERKGKLVLLIECKSGKKWNTGQPVNINAWRENIGDFAAEPNKLLAITDLLVEDDLYKEEKEKGLIFDRARIIRLLAEEQSAELQKIRDDITDLDLCKSINL